MKSRVVAPMILLTCGALLCLLVVLALFLGTSWDELPPAQSEADAHRDLTTTLGSEQAEVVVVAAIPVGQSCVAATVQALRQLVRMYPDELFVALIDMEAEFEHGTPTPVTFRGIDPTDTARLRQMLGYEPEEDTDEAGTEESPAEQAETPQAGDLLAVLERKEREAAEDPGMNQDEPPAAEGGGPPGPGLYCAIVTVNGDMEFEVPGDTDGEVRQMVLSGPHGILYTADDIKAVIETVIKERYGAIPEPREAWTPIAEEAEPGGEPLFPNRRPRE